MSRGRFQLNLLGRAGNQLFSMAFARAFCEHHDLTLEVGPWWGDKIFEHSTFPRQSADLPKKCENTILDSDVDISFCSYCQQQKCLIYSRADVRRWFVIKPQIKSLLDRITPSDDQVVAHRRVGDFPGYSYPVVSEKSYRDACDQFGLDKSALRFVTEENPLHHPAFSGGLEFVPDFYRLMRAPVLLRGNSCFSWWAATLGNPEVYSPVIDGLAGGVEHDCAFQYGNHNRFANLAFVTDLNLRE